MDWQDLSLLKSSYVCPCNCLRRAVISITRLSFLTCKCKCLPRLQRKVLFKNKCVLKVTIFLIVCTAYVNVLIIL